MKTGDEVNEAECLERVKKKARYLYLQGANSVLTSLIEKLTAQLERVCGELATLKEELTGK